MLCWSLMTNVLFLVHVDCFTWDQEERGDVDQSKERETRDIALCDCTCSMSQLLRRRLISGSMVSPRSDAYLNMLRVLSILIFCIDLSWLVHYSSSLLWLLWWPTVKKDRYVESIQNGIPFSMIHFSSSTPWLRFFERNGMTPSADPPHRPIPSPIILILRSWRKSPIFSIRLAAFW